MAGKRKVSTKTVEKKTAKTIAQKEKSELLKKQSELNGCVFNIIFC